jgi:hypothetical protein
LSACKQDQHVLDVTMRSSVQRHQRQHAEDVSRVAATAWGPWKHSRIAYSGEVPMSP